MEYFYLIAGLAVLVVGGEILVKGAVAIAYRFKISPLVVGMTIVSFGTSAPELLVSVQAAIDGHPDIAIGNVVGSNIANISLILGLTTIIFPIPVDRNTIRIDWPMMMLSTILFSLFILNGWLSRLESTLFVIIITGFVVWLVRNSRKAVKGQDIEIINPQNIYKSLVFVIAGCTGLAFGASWLLDGAVTIAEQFGLSDHFIGVTIVAFGTSVPELATSCIAAFRKQADISVGNLIGSNIFNILAILGVTGILQEIPISDAVLGYDIYWTLGLAFVILPLVIIDKKIDRFRGAALVLSYLAYMFFLI